MSTYRKADEGRANLAWSIFNDDFMGFASANYATTLVNSAGQPTVLNAEHGQLSLVTTGANNDAISLQYAGGTGAVKEIFRHANDRKYFFSARFRAPVLEALASTIVLGLMATSTTPASAPADGIFFRKASGSAALTLVARNGGVETILTTGITLAINTWYNIEFYYAADGKNVDAVVNGNRVGAIPVAAIPTATLAITAALRTNEAVSKTVLIDYIGLRQQRIAND